MKCTFPHDRDAHGWAILDVNPMPIIVPLSLWTTPSYWQICYIDSHLKCFTFSTGNEDITEIKHIRLSNGAMLQVPVKVKGTAIRNVQPDQVKNYFHSFLEASVTFRTFLRFCETPVRRNMLSAYKFMLQITRGCSTQVRHIWITVTIILFKRSVSLKWRKIPFHLEQLKKF